jgi:hypothetical protein
MKLFNLAAIRWFRNARKELPSSLYPGQTVPERCRETFANEVNWFANMIAKANRRDHS